MLSLIVAMAENNVIGSLNKIPWYMPRDLKHFSNTTKSHTVIIGRNTYESILARLGKPLPERNNIVVTRQTDFSAPGCTVVNSLQNALKIAGDNEEVFVIGGSQLYELALPLVDRLYITHIHATVDGDSFFPKFNIGDWNIISEEHHKKDDKNSLDSTYTVYERKK